MPKSIKVTDPATGRSAVVQYEDIADAEEQESGRQARKKAYLKYWQYYDNSQYEKENKSMRDQLHLTDDQRLPEHLRKHAYSGIITEGIDFITDQLMENMAIEVKTQKEVESGEPDETIPDEQTIFQRMWDESDMDLEAPDTTREALVSAEAYILLKWDEAEKVVKFLPYEAASVNPIYSKTNYKEMLMATIYTQEYSDTEETDIEVKEQYVLGQTSEGYRECVYLKFIEDDEVPVEAKLLNIPFIPIIHLRAVRKKLRKSFGESLVAKVIGDVERYNGVNHEEFQIARYNAKSHLALFGTESEIEPNQLFLGSEVNDFWAFPNTTEAKVLTMPTDKALIESQCEKLEKNAYKKMGLQKMDLEDIKGMGAPSGYALEIMNRKTDGVFTRIQKELSKGYITLFDTAMDMQAIMESGKEWWSVDPKTVYPNRTIQFTFGSVFIADSESIRQDYVAGLISRKRALMLKGYSEQDANKMADEVSDEKEADSATENEGLAAILRQNRENPE